MVNILSESRVRENRLHGSIRGFKLIINLEIYYEIISRYSGPVDTYEVKAPEGVEFKVEVERFIYPSEKDKLVSLSLNQWIF